MRPAATCLKSKKIAYKQEILEVRYGKVVSVQHTSPPPITMTGLSRTCQARIRDPPPWILGNLVELMLFFRGKSYRLSLKSTFVLQGIYFVGRNGKL